jgi:hypothetical protein
MPEMKIVQNTRPPRPANAGKYSFVAERLEQGRKIFSQSRERPDQPRKENIPLYCSRKNRPVTEGKYSLAAERIDQPRKENILLLQND